MTDERGDRDADSAAPTGQEWDAEGYEDDFGYVHEYGESVVDLLDPQPGERVLDLGCGTGHLTAEIAGRVGADEDGPDEDDANGDGSDGYVLGVDRSPEMIAEARETYPDRDFAVADATTLATEQSFDAVFSNAVLHWIDDQDAVAERVHQALVPGGRFVAELGGQGNVATIVDAVADELAARGYEVPDPFYFPSVGEHASLLERHGFEVRYARLFDRPTELEGGEDGLQNWLAMFGEGALSHVDDEEQDALVEAVENRLREELYDPDTETWTADYRRLRFVAVRPE